MKIENRTELKEYRMNVRKNNRLTAEYWFAGEPDVWQVDQARFMKVKRTDKRSYRGRSKDRGRNRTYKGYEEWMSWLLRDGTSW